MLQEMQPTKRYCLDMGRLCSHRCKFCVPGKTYIRLKDGIGGKSILNLKPGEIIYAYNEKTKQHENTEVLDVMKRETEENIYEIFISTQKTKLRITPKHPVLTKRGWINVEDLTTEDEVWTETFSERTSKHMISNNPMKNKDVVKRVVATGIRNDLRKGWTYIHNLSTIENIKTYEEVKNDLGKN